jgi:predicted nucleotidyltransferase
VTEKRYVPTFAILGLMKEAENTPYPELDNVLEDYARKIQETVKANFVGFYLQGSLALGDFDLTSDVDFVVITKEDLLDEQVRNVKRIHKETYNKDNRWVKRFEYSFFPKSKLKTLSSPYTNGVRNNAEERKLWYFDNGSLNIERSDHCNTLVTRWTVREKGITLLGPDPKTLLDPIEPNELRKEIKDTMIGWGEELLENPSPYENRFYQSYLVLNYARMLQNLYKGEIGSKLRGIMWAKSNLDPNWVELMDFCWKERQDTEISVKQPANPGIFNKSLEFVRYAVDQGRKYKLS